MMCTGLSVAGHGANGDRGLGRARQTNEWISGTNTVT